jgi:transcriptional regulator with XRE-family HTH domain
MAKKVTTQVVAHQEINLNTTISFKLAQRMSTLGSMRGDSVSSLAARAQVSTGTIYRFLNAGIRAYNPTINTLAKLAGAFKLPVHAFIDLSKTGKAAITSKK